MGRPPARALRDRPRRGRTGRARPRRAAGRGRLAGDPAQRGQERRRARSGGRDRATADVPAPAADASGRAWSISTRRRSRESRPSGGNPRRRPAPPASGSVSGAGRSGPRSRAASRRAATGLRRLINGQPRSPHTGYDWAAPAGTPVLAANAGRVALVAEHFFAGRNVMLDHGLGALHPVLPPDRGARLQAGECPWRVSQVIGTVGATGRVTGPLPPLRRAPRRRAGRSRVAPAPGAAGRRAGPRRAPRQRAGSRRGRAGGPRRRAHDRTTPGRGSARGAAAPPARHLDHDRGIQEALGATEPRERAEPDQEGPEGRQSQPRLARGHWRRVRAALVEGEERFVDQRVQEGRTRGSAAGLKRSRGTSPSVARSALGR